MAVAERRGLALLAVGDGQVTGGSIAPAGEFLAAQRGIQPMPVAASVRFAQPSWPPSVHIATGSARPRKT